MRRVFAALTVTAVAVALVVAPAAGAKKRHPATGTHRVFATALSSANDVPQCSAAVANHSFGFAILWVKNPTAGTVAYALFAFNLPDAPTAAHIHLAPRGQAGPIVQPLTIVPNAPTNGLVGFGTFTNPDLVTAIRANPAAYYVNIHTAACPAGAARGQL